MFRPATSSEGVNLAPRGLAASPWCTRSGPAPGTDYSPPASLIPESLASLTPEFPASLTPESSSRVVSKHNELQYVLRHRISFVRPGFPLKDAEMAPLHAVNSVPFVPSRHVSIGPQMQSSAHVASSAEQCIALHDAHTGSRGLDTGSEASQFDDTPLSSWEPVSSWEPPLSSWDALPSDGEGPDVVVHPCAAIAAMPKPRRNRTRPLIQILRAAQTLRPRTPKQKRTASSAHTRATGLRRQLESDVRGPVRDRR